MYQCGLRRRFSGLHISPADQSSWKFLCFLCSTSEHIAALILQSFSSCVRTCVGRSWPDWWINCQQWRWNYLQLQHGCCCLYCSSYVLWEKFRPCKKISLPSLRKKGHVTLVLVISAQTEDWTRDARRETRIARWWKKEHKTFSRANLLCSVWTRRLIHTIWVRFREEDAFLHSWDRGPVRWERIYIRGEY